MKRSQRLLLELAVMSSGEQHYYLGMLEALGLPQTEVNLMFVVSRMLALKQKAAESPPN